MLAGIRMNGCRGSSLLSLSVAVVMAGATLSVSAQPLAPVKVCQPNDAWFRCADKVKKAIKGTNDPKVALFAGTEWAERYDQLYKASARDTWTITDQEMLEQAMSKMWDETVGKYLDAPTLAFGLALARYFPKLAATLEMAGGAYVTFFITLLAPSPIANDFTAAGTDNAEINKLVMSKLPPLGAMTIQQRYPELFSRAYEKVKGKKPVLP